MTEATRFPEPRILQRSEHSISRKNISDNALKVLYRLQTAGFKAYLVGGGVRDLLLGRQPKDFDAATDARPNEIRRLFRNSRIIGRRFRLVHVFFKDGVVEVSTFRRDPDPDEQQSAPGELLITSDNAFGSPAEDAFRRDFTVNALFYNLADFSVIDYVGGIDDLQGRSIRVIGDPRVRFCEDPVRMLRACEFAARLSFGIERETQEAIQELAKEIAKASAARLTEEVIQLLRCGQSGRAMQWMLELGLLDALLPEAYAMVSAGERGLGDFGRILPTVDALVRAGTPPGDSALLAILLLPTVLLRRYDVEASTQRAMRRTALEELVREVVEPFASRFTLSRLRIQEIQHALLTFQHLGDSRWNEAERLRLARRPGFQDALALLEVMVQTTQSGHEVLVIWQEAWQKALKLRPVEHEPAAAEGEEHRVEKRGGRPYRQRRRRRG